VGGCRQELRHKLFHNQPTTLLAFGLKFIAQGCRFKARLCAEKNKADQLMIAVRQSSHPTKAT
jgi:hypothetical protein